MSRPETVGYPPRSFPSAECECDRKLPSFRGTDGSMQLSTPMRASGGRTGLGRD